ncbi:TylF/MycF/NovP-related O-methyltransferase [Polyangium jinanense]|uniref:Class I SAM-dependent methyltransferase n=1 Tax=Polyangium jinanense TaxID=2829994 RepID=A0A9X3XAW8_9BACT|nr:TylF/MycF/NovP-related O-methyltransferase [Polyangium jinanense]MDC3962377.1 class I SAM-dependent methyltransferase [Polyangium jinanense]MDC3985870.1 class I SAM-dependent methyltransferase [Polyangium jinanense]
MKARVVSELVRARERVKSLLRFPPRPAMSADNLYAYLDALYQKRNVEGPVVEIGVASGGTTAYACDLLSRIGCKKEYYCFDTFDGFVEEHLDTDHKLGLTPRHDHSFRGLSLERVRANLARWSIRRNIHFVKGDICKIDDAEIPENISVALLDVDLRDPIYVGLKKLTPKLAKGGVILVDDCKANTSWVGADVGYLDFVRDHGLQPKYFLGFAVVEKTDGDAPSLSWSFSQTANTTPQNFFA